MKEVKQLRSQLEKVGGERQLYRAQLQALRDALTMASRVTDAPTVGKIDVELARGSSKWT